MKFLSSFASGRPVLIDPNQIGAISDIALRDMFEGAEELAVIELASMSYREDDEGFYYNQETGIAVIPILGVLMNRMSWSYGFATGYDYIRSAFNAAMDRPEVKGIVFDVNSPGGQAAGNFELAAEIAETRGRKKPTMAIVNSMAASGGYSLATAADRIVAMPSAAIGSIGVVSTHVSFEKNLEKAGIEVTFIYAGKHKVDGNPYQSLPKSVKSSMLASVERIYDNFVSVVANNRGIDAQDVRDTEAAMYDSEEALARGLIDAIQTPSEAMASFISGLSSPTIRKTVMTAKHNSEGAEVTVTPVVAAEVAAPVEAAPVVAAEVAAPVVAAAPAVDQKARIKTILTSAEAAGRTELAEHLAYETDMAADAVVALLSKAPKAEAKQANDFVKVMDSIEHPNVGGGEVGSGEKELSVSDRIIRNFKVVTGRK